MNRHKQTVRRHLLLFLLITALSVCGCRSRQHEAQPHQVQVSRPPAAVQAGGGRSSLVFEEPNLPQPTEVREAGQGTEPVCTPPPAGTTLPRISIIIDDMGYHKDISARLLDLPLNLTFSFLPGAPFTHRQEEQAFQKGRDILVHLPMEAHDPAWNPGPGALYLSFSPNRIVRTVNADLQAVPHAIGANNHMGSRFTENRPAMRLVLTELKKHHFFFIDSYTTARSTGMDEARQMGIRTGRRHVFLDNVHDRDKICDQLKKLITVAEKQGWAIGIGHPNQATLEALTRCREKLLQHATLVGVHELVR